jgi:hypothetical protein
VWWAQGSPGSDVEDYIADLVAQGWDDESIAEERRQADELMEPRLIWPENWSTVQVFACCMWTRHVGMNGQVWMGISAAEVRAAAQMLHVPRKEWPEMLYGVALMVEAAKPHLNAAADQE